MKTKIARRLALLATVSTIAASPALADPTNATPISSIGIVNGINPSAPAASGGAYDTTVNVTGVGQIVTDIGGGFVGTCTGTLINPRTVIFASHCVNEEDPNAYGAASGGIPISVGFSQNNVPGLLSWLFGQGGSIYGTNINTNLYNIEQVWYDPRATQTPAGSFYEDDIALGTLDTPAFGVPTWALLFSPLTQEEHATIVGYGSFGNGTNGTASNGNFRRRAAENMVSFLGSLNDLDGALFGFDPSLPQNLYMTDFDDPKFGHAGASPFDFNIFGGSALPREGMTGPGDSGGPLIIDKAFSKPVVAGVLSFGTRYFSAQPGGSYGTTSGYQPLYLFWDQIVANNPYVYVNNKAGNADWTDPAHWVQAMDPNYSIIQNGALANSLPDTPALGVSGDGVKFGKVCFFSDCIDPLTGTAATGSGTPVFVAGGPGSTDFVPNNVVADPTNGVRAHYYDVTLSAQGTTTLGSDVTIDRLTLNGPTKLDIGAGGNLKVWGDDTQWAGWTNVNGSLTTGDMLVATGILSGSGTIDPTFLTVVSALVSPGNGNTPQTLTVKGDVILSSGSLLMIDAGRSGADLLKIVGDQANSGMLMLDGGSLLFNKAAGAAPRDGDSFTIVTATGGIDGTFGNIGSLMGVLKPVLTYGDMSIIASLRAGKFTDYVGTGVGIVGSFANALDTLRAGSYNSLYGLYGTLDLMSPEAVSASFQSMAPRIDSEAQTLQERQSRTMFNAVSDRLSLLGTEANGTLTFSGTPTAIALNRSQLQGNSFSDLGPASSASLLPKGVSGFVTGGNLASRSGYGDGNLGQHSSYMAIGMETEVVSGLTIGSAGGYADGVSIPGTDEARIRTSQAALYGSYRLGGGAYVAAMAMAENSNAKLSRTARTGNVAFDLTGATHSERYTAAAEAGVNVGLGKGLLLTPRAQLGFSTYHLAGFREHGGEAALQVDDLRLRKVEARLGVKLAGSRAIGGGWSFVPQVQADYVHLLSGSDDGLAVRFAQAADYRFVLPLAGGASSYGEVRGGVEFAKDRMAFGAGLETSIGPSDLLDKRATAHFSLRF